MNCFSKNSPTQINCLKHPDKKVVFIQTKEIQENKTLLLCSNCLDDFVGFQTQNGIWLDKVLDIKDNDIIDKWPLLNDDSLHKKIQYFTQKNKEVDFSEEILKFFDNLKQEFIQKIEDIKKQMIAASQQLPNHQNHLIEEIKKLSQTNTLKQIFIDSKNNSKQIDDKIREYIKKFETKKQDNTKIFQSLIEQYEKNLKIFDLKTRNQFNSSFQQIFSLVDVFFSDLSSFDILPLISFIKTNFQKSQQCLQIVKSQNNQISISQNEDKQYTNCVSDFILDEHTNYVFRFQFINNSETQQEVYIGLVRDSLKDQKQGYIDNLSCRFKINQNSFYVGGYGIDKKEKGDFSSLKCQEVEMRVCIKNGILQVLDYPNYNHILSINYDHKNKLQEYQNFRLNISNYNKNLKLNLIQAYKSLTSN